MKTESKKVNLILCPKLTFGKIQRQEKGSLTVISHLNHGLNHNSKIYKVHQFFDFHYLVNFRQSITVKPVHRREKWAIYINGFYIYKLSGENIFTVHQFCGKILSTCTRSQIMSHLTRRLLITHMLTYSTYIRHRLWHRRKQVAPLLHVCGIPHCTWRSFEEKYEGKPLTYNRAFVWCGINEKRNQYDKHGINSLILYSLLLSHGKFVPDTAWYKSHFNNRSVS